MDTLLDLVQEQGIVNIIMDYKESIEEYEKRIWDFKRGLETGFHKHKCNYINERFIEEHYNYFNKYDLEIISRDYELSFDFIVKHWKDLDIEYLKLNNIEHIQNLLLNDFDGIIQYCFEKGYNPDNFIWKLTN